MVKLWEFEASHKSNIDQWESISDLKKYTIQVKQIVDGKVVEGPIVPGADAKEIGNYSALMAQCPSYQKVIQKLKQNNPGMKVFLKTL